MPSNRSRVGTSISRFGRSGVRALTCAVLPFVMAVSGCGGSSPILQTEDGAQPPSYSTASTISDAEPAAVSPEELGCDIDSDAERAPDVVRAGVMALTLVTCPVPTGNVLLFTFEDSVAATAGWLAAMKAVNNTLQAPIEQHAGEIDMTCYSYVRADYTPDPGESTLCKVQEGSTVVVGLGSPPKADSGPLVTILGVGWLRSRAISPGHLGE